MATKVTFNDVVNDNNAAHSKELTFAIRTDEQYATGDLIKRITAHFKNNPTVSPDAIKGVVHDAYRVWSAAALKEIVSCIDYSRYPLPQGAPLAKVEFYDAEDLAQEAMIKGAQLVKKGAPVLYVTLDEMIKGSAGEGAELAFSREFCLNSEQQAGYRTRPGKKPIEAQVQALAARLQQMKAEHGSNVGFVLLEDNIRHANMLNWVIDLMQQNGVFEAGNLAGISTCFNVASPEELAKIVHDGKSVPVTAVVNFAGTLTDVLTPRDLFFDGHVVNVNGKLGRLPSMFMDAVKLFKIDPVKADEFRLGVARINTEFCEQLGRAFGVTVPLSWFPAAEAVAHVTSLPLETAMTDVIRKQLPTASRSPKILPSETNPNKKRAYAHRPR